jgi:hypothetical protein
MISVSLHRICPKGAIVSIVQWIERRFPKPLIRVRFPVGILSTKAVCYFSEEVWQTAFGMGWLSYYSAEGCNCCTVRGASP